MAERPRRPLHAPVVNVNLLAAGVRHDGAEAAAIPTMGADAGDRAARGTVGWHGAHPLASPPVHAVPAGASGPRRLRSPSGKAARNRAASPDGAASRSSRDGVAILLAGWWSTRVAPKR